jgi:twitching motility protein PilJ
MSPIWTITVRALSLLAAIMLVVATAMSGAQYFGFAKSSGFELFVIVLAAMLALAAIGASNFLSSASRSDLHDGAAIAHQIAQGSVIEDAGKSELHESLHTISIYLKEKKEIVERIANGDLSVKTEIRSDADQFGLALQNMIDRLRPAVQTREDREQLQASVLKLLAEVSDVADGDLTVQAKVGPEITGEIAVAFNSMTRSLRTLIKQVKTVTIQVGASASAIHETTEQLARGSLAQSGQLARTTSSIAKMAYQIQEVSANASVSAEVASDSLTSARYGLRAAKDNIGAMDAIRKQVQETAKRIKRLGERAQEIGQITTLIDDLSDRTSLLALNASLQAAAAGNTGNGFAVVAEEVERLADRSNSLTQQISSLSQSINAETKEVVAAMEDTIQEVVVGSRLADRAGRSLVEIEEVSTKLADLLRSISESAKFQAKGSEDISKAMIGIAEITEMVQGGSSRAAESVRLLVDLSNELRASVAPFKLPADISETAIPTRERVFFVN